MPSFQKILAATDLSACAGTAVQVAGEIARRTMGDLTVLHVDPGLPRYTSALTGERTYALAAKQLRRGARTEFQEHVSLYAADGSPVERLVETGRPATEIVTASNELGADLIVIGTQGRGPLTRALIGSVAEEVIRASSRPVLSIRCRKSPLVPEFRRIACAVGYATPCRGVLDAAIAFASAFDATLIAVHVVERSGSNEEEDLARLREWIGNETFAVESRVLVRRRRTAPALIDFAGQEGVDLLVAGSKPTPLGDEPPSGSTTATLTLRSRCPVLTVPV